MAARADTITGLVHKRSSKNIVMQRLMHCQWLKKFIHGRFDDYLCSTS